MRVKRLVKQLLYEHLGVVVRRRESWMNNYRWLSEMQISTVLDVGANIGQFATFIRGVLPEAYIHSFEPIPSVFHHLQRQIGGMHAVALHNFGLGDLESDATINVNENTPSSSLLELDSKHIARYSYAVRTRVERIHIKRLDSVLDPSTLARNILIKVDVQGYEDKVITGGTELFKAAKVAIIEISYVSMYKNQLLFDDIAAQMRQLGYRFKGNFSEQAYDLESGEPLFTDGIFVNEAVQ